MREYTISSLSEELVYIRWHTTPTMSSTAEHRFLDDLKAMLDEADRPQYFISDLRKGRIKSMRAIQKLGYLTAHPNWAGSTAFSEDPLTKMYVHTFVHFARHTTTRDEMHSKPEDALKFLESLKPGLTQEIDWDAVLSDGTTASVGD